MSQWTPEFNELYTLKVAMKSGTPDAPTTQESLKAVLLHPQPLGATKSFPAEVEMINSKVGNEFSHLCDDSQKQEKDMTGNQQEQEKSGVVRKKRKSQQAGPSYVQNCVKENQEILGRRQQLETPSDEDNDSSLTPVAPVRMTSAAIPRPAPPPMEKRTCVHLPVRTPATPLLPQEVLMKMLW